MKPNKNVLDFIPEYTKNVTLSEGGDGQKQLDVCHTGWADKVAQKVFGRPKVSHISLDRFGSFVCGCIDGKRDIYTIGQLVRAEFGDAAEPLYDRLVLFFRTLKNNGFVTWKK